MSTLQRTLDAAEELHEEDFDKMLLAIEEGKSRQEELELTKESLTRENEDLQSKLQASKQAHSDEVTTLNEDLEKLRSD
eukprot:9459482-Ditylum_brightwellii.AAC.1